MDVSKVDSGGIVPVQALVDLRMRLKKRAPEIPETKIDTLVSDMASSGATAEDFTKLETMTPDQLATIAGMTVESMKAGQQKPAPEWIIGKYRETMRSMMEKKA